MDFWTKGLNPYRIFPNKCPGGLQNIYDFKGGGSVYWRGALIKERRLFKRNRILTIGSFLFSMFLNYNSISMRSYSESLGSMRLLFASSVSKILMNAPY